jgi:hypothetical protein
MQVSCQVNTQGFEAACLALAKVSGRSMQETVESELAKVIDRTIEFTPSSTASRIRKTFDGQTFTAQPSTLYAPQTSPGRTVRSNARVSKSGKLFYFLENRYPNALWTQIAQRRKESLQRKIAAIGLAKKSWWVIAKALGLPVKLGRFANAQSPDGRDHPENFSVSKSVRETDIAVAFINSQPTVTNPKVGGRRALQSAIDGRVKYFLTNVQLGVFKSMDNIAKRYPGLKLTSG